MKKNILGLFLFCLIAIFMFGCNKKTQPVDLYDVIQARGRIIVGVKTDTKPFGYKDKDGNIVGYDIDLAKRIAKALFNDETKVEFVPVTVSNKILAVNSGQADMIIAAMTITPQRYTVVDFSIPYYVAGQTVLIPKNSDIKSLNELNNKKIAVVFASTAEKGIKMIAPNANVLGYKTYQEAIQALKDKTVDALAADDTILSGLIDNDKNYKIFPQKYSHENYAVAFRKGEESRRLIEFVNEVITQMSSDGSLKKQNEKWVNKK